LLVLATCCASMVVVVMGISIVTVALPAIRRDLHASVSGLQWTVDAYTLVLASFLVLAGSIADRAERARAIGVFGAMSGLSLALGPILGGALVDGFGWRSIFWVNVPIVAAAIVCTALFVPESRAARARRFDPVGQTLMILVLGSVVYAIIESNTWAGPRRSSSACSPSPGWACWASSAPTRAVSTRCWSCACCRSGC
jgi:MFS family permease